MYSYIYSLTKFGVDMLAGWPKLRVRILLAHDCISAIAFANSPEWRYVKDGGADMLRKMGLRGSVKLSTVMVVVFRGMVRFDVTSWEAGLQGLLKAK
jgi:hypothetical protein